MCLPFTRFWDWPDAIHALPFWILLLNYSSFLFLGASCGLCLLSVLFLICSFYTLLYCLSLIFARLPVIGFILPAVMAMERYLFSLHRLRGPHDNLSGFNLLLSSFSLSVSRPPSQLSVSDSSSSSRVKVLDKLWSCNAQYFELRFP
jgi:hypothetical protein